jgi:hypothetical protein
VRYIIALGIVGVLLGTLSLCANQAANALQKRMRQKMIAPQAAGQIQADVDLDSGDFTDFGTEVTSAELLQLGMLDSWFAYRTILIPALIAIGLVVARYWPSPASPKHLTADKTSAPPT